MYILGEGFPGGANSSKEPTCQCSRHETCVQSLGWEKPQAGKVPWRWKWQLIPVFCPGNPMDREAWWATVHRVPKSWTWLKWQHVCMYLKFKAYIKINSWCCVFYEFWQMYLYNEIYTSLQYHIGHLHCPKALLYLFTYPFPLSPGNHWKYL